MADELIDRFDEDGKFVGTIMKSQAHKIGAWHKSVHIYLVNKDNELLVQQRASDKDLYPNTWDISVGGHVSAGEKTIVSAQRELGEELGLDADLNDFEYLFTYKEILSQGDFVSKEFVDVFLLIKNVKNDDIKLQEEEVSNFKFIPVSKFLEMIESKDSKLLPHWFEYEKIKDILKSRFV